MEDEKGSCKRKETGTERAISFSVKDLGMCFKLEICLKHFKEKDLSK